MLAASATRNGKAAHEPAAVIRSEASCLCKQGLAVEVEVDFQAAEQTQSALPRLVGQLLAFLGPFVNISIRK